MTADSTEGYATIDEIYQKFSPIFQYENIDKLSEDDFSDFFQSSNVGEFFVTRRSFESLHAGQVRKPNFTELKKALKILVDETSPLEERLDKIFAENNAVWSGRQNHFKPAIFSSILHLVNPDKYAIFNRHVQDILESQYIDKFDSNDWKTYERANRKLNYLAVERNCSLYELDQQLGGQSSKPNSSYYKKLKEAIEGIQDQANYQYVMIRFLLGKKSATRDKIAEELKRWNGDKPDNFNFRRAPVFDTNIVKNFVVVADDTFQIEHRGIFNFYERHQLISLCEEKIKERINTYNEGTIPYSDLVFSPLTDKQEIKKVHDKVVSTLSGASSKNKEFKAYQMYGKGYWLDKHGVFFYTADPTTIKENHFWDVFGTREPSWDRKGLVMSEGNKDWILEINPPIEGGWHVSGQFLKDNQGRIYYTHNGSITAKKSKNNFRFNDIYAGLALKTSNYSDGKKHSPQYIISDVANSGLVDDVTDFVKEVQDFRNFAETPEYQALGEEEHTGHWMIRAGGTIEVCPEDCKKNHAKYGEASVVNAGRHVDKVIQKGWDWDNQRTNHFAGIHYYDVDLSKCTERDGVLSEEKVKEKVDKIRRDRGDTELTLKGWGADYGQLQMLFSINRTGSKSRIFVVGKNKDLLGFGDAISQYEYKEGLPNPHAINVKWIDTNKRELPESFGMSGFNRSIKELSKEEYDLIMASKYQPLTDFLQGKYPDEVTLTLDKDGDSVIIKNGEETIQALPDSAGNHGAWWANNDDTHPQSKSWGDVGYKTAGVTDPPTSGGIITFVKCDTLQKVSKIQKYIDVMEWKQNLILYGPPGTGKTWKAKQIAKEFIRLHNNSNEANTYSNVSGKGNWFKSLKDQISSRASDWKIDTSQGEEYFKLKSSSDEKRIFVSYGNKNNPDKDLVEVGIKEKATSWLKEIPSDSSFVLVINMSQNSFVVLPYEVLRKAKFRGGENWDSSGETKMWFNLTVTSNDSILNTNDTVENGKHDCSEYLFNIDQVFTSNPKFVTFHQSYSYEEFVEGIKVKVNEDKKYVTYEVESGIFKEFCDYAKGSNKKYVLIIDEINRGNISKVFGELITIIENDKRGDKVTLAYSKKPFFVPKNVYVIGTMNTADQSIARIDIALRRRFAHEELMPDSSVLKNKDIEGINLTKLLDAINEKILEDNMREKQIGHSYLMSGTEPIDNIKELQMTFAYNIIPLLREYYFDNDSELQELLNEEFLDWDKKIVKEDWKKDSTKFKNSIKNAFPTAMND